MSILTINDLKFGYENDGMYNSLSFQLELFDHATLVGPNGCGKTTLMKIISGLLSPDSGKVEWERGVKYAYLDQQLEVKEDVIVSEYLYGVYNDLFKKEEKINDLYIEAASASPDDATTLLERAEEIRLSLETANFYNIETEINNVIVGLGLKDIDLKNHLKILSGGEKAKVYLAKMLLEKPDVILMDEPTNFLDKPHVKWLENYLNNFKGTFLVISHDQSFLANISRVVYAIENKKLIKYKGDYNYYLKEKNARFEQARKEYEKQVEFIKKTKIFIQKNIVRASTTKQAQSRRKMLEKIDILEKPKTEYQIKLRFPYSRDLGQHVLELNELEIGYKEPLLPPLTLLVKKNERIEVVGKNGVGKTTLIKTLLDVIKPLSGSYRFNPSADINYFSQEEDIDLTKTPMDYIRMLHPDLTNEEVLRILAPLGIKNDLARKNMEFLSGGELARVRLARMTKKKSNILILDEPTNHLDKLSKDILRDAIEAFPGSVILVSHEKGFADDLVDYAISFKKGE